MSDAKGSTKMIVLTALVLIVCVGGALWFRAVNTMPAISIPSRTLPSPNAFDYYVDAGNKLTHHKDEIGFATDDRPRTQPSGYDRVYSLAEKEVIVHDNAQALDRLRQGFAYQCMNPPCRSYDTGFPHAATWREMSRLLVLEAQTREGRGNWDGAANSCIDAVYFGQDIPRGGVLIHSLVGIAMQAIARREGWKTIEHLSSDEAHAAARRMEEIISREVPYAEVIEEEKWCGVASLSDMMRKPGWYGQIMSPPVYPAGTSGGNPATNVLLNLKGLTLNKGRVIRNYSRYMDQLVSNAHLPYRAKPASPPIPNDEICQILCPVFDRARFAHVYRIETQNALFAVSLALRAYRAEHGRYPNALVELVPSYLSKLPDDPFALKGPLSYKKTGDNYVLYSIGPDGKDDGGTPVFNPARPKNDVIGRHLVEQSSKGDIVAGINQ